MPERVASDCSQGTFFWVFRLLFFFAWAIWLWARKAMHWCTHLHMKGFVIPFLNQSGWSVHQWIIFKTETEDDPLTQSPKFWKTLFRHWHKIKYAPLLLSDQGNCMVLQALAELVQLQRRKASNKIRSRLFPTGTQKQWENKQLSGCSTGSGTHHTISSDKSSIHRRLKFTILATEMIWTGTSNIFHRALCFQDRWNTACNKWGRAFVQVTPARTRILAKQGTKSTVSVSVPHASSWTAWWHSRASQLSSWPLPSESSRVNRSFASNLRLPRRQQKLHQAVAIQTATVATVATVSFTSFHWKVNKGRHDDTTMISHVPLKARALEGDWAQRTGMSGSQE